MTKKSRWLSRPFTDAPVIAQADGCQPLSVPPFAGNWGGTAERALRPLVGRSVFILSQPRWLSTKVSKPPV